MLELVGLVRSRWLAFMSSLLGDQGLSLHLIHLRSLPSVSNGLVRWCDRLLQPAVAPFFALQVEASIQIVAHWLVCLGCVQRRSIFAVLGDM